MRMLLWVALLLVATPAAAVELRLDQPTATNPADPSLLAQANGSLAAWYTAEVAGEREHFAAVSPDAGLSWPAPEQTGVMASWRGLLAQPFHMYPYGYSIQANPNGTVALLAKAERQVQGELQAQLYLSLFEQQGRQLLGDALTAWGPEIYMHDIGPGLYLGGPSWDTASLGVTMEVNGWPGDNYPLPSTSSPDAGSSWTQATTFGPGDFDITDRLHARQGDRAIAFVGLRDADTYFYQHVAARVSGDGGATWGPWTILETEPAPDAWGDGPTLLAAATPVDGLWWARYERAGQTVNCWSTDGGSSWNAPTALAPTDASGRTHHYDPAALDHHWGEGTLRTGEPGYLVEWEDDGLFPIEYRWSSNYGLSWRAWEPLPTSSAPGETCGDADFDLVAPGVFGAVYTKASGGVWFARAAAATAAPAPTRLSLRAGPATPNPATHGTRVDYEGPAGHWLQARVVDTRGRLVRALPRTRIPDSGRGTLRWDRRDDAGRSVATGSYHLQLRAGQQGASAKLLVLR